MWVSRLSIKSPGHPRGENIPADLDLSPQRSEEIGRLPGEGNDPGHGLSVLGDDQTLGRERVQERQTLLFELRSTDPFHAIPSDGRKIRLVTKYGHFPWRSSAQAGESLTSPIEPGAPVSLARPPRGSGRPSRRSPGRPRERGGRAAGWHLEPAAAPR